MIHFPCGHSGNYKNIDYRHGVKICRTCRELANAQKKAEREAIKALIQRMRDQGHMPLAIARLTGISINVVRKACEDYISASERSRLSDPLFPSRAIKVAAREAGANIDQFRLNWKHREMVLARQAFILAMHKRGFPSPSIGKWLARDHSTVLNGLKRARERASNDSAFLAVFERVNAA